MRTDSAPFRPGIDPVRYEWLPDDDIDVVRLRLGFPESEGWLFVVREPVERQRYLIEAYWPWEIRDPAYRRPSVEFLPTADGNLERITLSAQLNPYQYADFRQGRLVCVKEHEPIDVRLTDAAVAAIKRRCRLTRRRYSYYESPPTHNWAAEWKTKRAEREEARFRDQWQDPVEELADGWAGALTPHQYVAEDIN